MPTGHETPVPPDEINPALSPGLALIIRKLGVPGHEEYAGLNGYVLNTNSPYDGSGDNKAHDRATRRTSPC